MKALQMRLAWIGLGLAILYWFTESLLHSFVFDSIPLADTLLGGHDPDEIWMRSFITVLFVAFGWLADRSIQAERHLRQDAQRLNRLLRFLDEVKQFMQRPADTVTSVSRLESLGNAVSQTKSPHGASAIEELALGGDEIARLARFLQDLSSFVDLRFKELYALLQLTHEINMGLLLDEVLEKAYQTLQAILPYNRLSVALLENNGRLIRARWVLSDDPDMLVLRAGYCGLMEKSSLQGIISSGEPRILSDLAAYLDAHPHSDSTRMMVAEGIRSSLTCPLFSAGKPIGFMFFSSRGTDTYKNVHVEIFKVIAGHLSVVVEKSHLYEQVLDEKQKSERLLLNVMPARIAARLSAGKRAVAEKLPEVNVFFADIVSFTPFASRYAPERVVELLENIFVPLDRLCDIHGVEKIKTVGDEYMAMTRPENPGDDGPLRNLAEFALETLELVEGMRYPDGHSVRIRIGMHTGPAVAGVIGQKKFAYDIWGDAVNVASRMESSGEAGRIHVSQEVYARLQTDFQFELRGTREIKGKGPMSTYFLMSRK